MGGCGQSSSGCHPQARQGEPGLGGEGGRARGVQGWRSDGTAARDMEIPRVMVGAGGMNFLLTPW